MNLNLTGVQIRCPNCTEIYYQTTDLYDPKKILTGEMLEWLPKYGEGGFNWSLPFAAHDLSEAVLCEGCGSSIAPNGYLGLDKLIFDEDKPKGAGEEITDQEILKPIILPLNYDPEEQPPVINKTSPQDQEGEETLDPVAKYTTLKSCPECGGFYNLIEWEAHLASHPPEVREKILRPPVQEEPTPAQPKESSDKKPKKIKKAGPPEPPALLCPMCEATFEKNQDYNDHLSTHDMGQVLQKGDN